MKKENKYKFNDFLRYYKGEMTKSERHSLEKESQGNPFLEESLEGLETIPAEIAEKDIKDLRSRLYSRVRGKRSMIIYRIAASIAVIMIISSVFIVVEKNNSVRQEPASEYKPVTIDIAKSEPVYKQEEKEEKAPPPIAGKRNRAAQEEIIATQPASTSTSDNETKVLENEPVKQEDAEASKKEVNYAVRKMPDNDQAAVEGLAESRKAAVAGSRSMTDSAIPAAEEKAGDIPQSTDYIPPQPSVGTEAFDKYIYENAVRPDPATAGQRVVVVTSVKVLADGRIDSIKIIRSPGKTFSDEAMRLIRSGPSWKPAIRDGIAIEDEVRLRIVFP